ncbi:MAG: hypothetical protein A3C70_02090 [Candidatus Zambryskibacteria bacterium RIFCSPHIGHO2_02_FULL_43_14]|uniref:Bifunctional protein FolD n=1 Tax=Candidatus Zambryskibacteria bacterium RIFCSPHIGHO2_02_FULL_43_14 TaxID=1802748 RepID=A0A1G2TIR3_9BACT|nr:MAG: hypothetical protein A2829_01330 [Candidatus Zambryskibacteria bacterium RIFCSPHIGHO2_01_FULL_43_60]OHA97073.1 MAG: hypothetical protein A3C70_02090 [Candidatus Zambryskibacteria bacterium RIFCSPHIGHO2_02_FULL_43_14]
MSIILDGKKLSNRLALKLMAKISKLAINPKLVIIQIGNLDRTNVYIKKKKEFAEKIGAKVLHEKYPKNIQIEKVISNILKFNKDRSIHGIIVQLPLPKNFDTTRIIMAIDQRKDVDGLTAKNTRLLFDKKNGFVPATAKGILTLFKNYKIDLTGKKITMVGQSSLVGRPIALALLNEGATVTVCHTHTRNLKEETKRADIIVVAAGHPGLITKNHVSSGQIVIDVGITLKNGKVVGDVDYEKVSKIVKAITPVPGGVGPMTVFSLFENLVKAYLLNSSNL